MEFRRLLWTALFCASISEAVDYSDIQALGAACYPRDTCNRERITFPNISCECDNMCLSYNDCCFDVPPAKRRSRVQRLRGLSCINYSQHQGVYAIGRCSSSWTGPHSVRTRCENEDDFSSPLLSIPATDTLSHITYRNRYCADCNDVNPNVLSTWSPTLTCDSLKPIKSQYNNITLNFIAQNITRTGNSWGVYHWNQSRNGMSFYPCDISSSLPESLARHVRHCVPNTVSACPPKWNRATVRRNCESYMAVVFVNGQAYRNVHCALCSLGSLTSVRCLPPAILSRDTPSLSFTLLLDVNPQDGNTVGAKNSCPSDQLYDPFVKKCQDLVCAIPGYVRRNGRCVRQ